MKTETQIRERPILFSSEMVRAIIDNRKTQTRRILNPQPPEWCDEGGWTMFTPPGSISFRGTHPTEGYGEKFIKARFEQGMHLWVRENFRIHDADGTKRGISYNADPEDSAVTWLESGEPWESAIEAMGIDAFGKFEPNGVSRPSIHMPRWASRLTLEVTRLRVERLQDISEADAMAEGIYNPRADSGMWFTSNGTDRFCNAITAYWKLWEEINGVGSWERNPFVFVIEFRKLEQPR